MVTESSTLEWKVFGGDPSQGTTSPDLEFISIADFKLLLIGLDISSVFHVYIEFSQVRKKLNWEIYCLPLPPPPSFIQEEISGLIFTTNNYKMNPCLEDWPNMLLY